MKRTTWVGLSTLALGVWGLVVVAAPGASVWVLAGLWAVWAMRP